jgi:hypothetical protein
MSAYRPPDPFRRAKPPSFVSGDEDDLRHGTIRYSP